MQKHYKILIVIVGVALTGAVFGTLYLDDKDKIRLDIVEKGRDLVRLNPTDTCAAFHLDHLAQPDIDRYKNDERGLDESNILVLTDADLEEIPDIKEMIYAVNTLDFPKTTDTAFQIGIAELVEYETFLMNKSIQKYGDTKEDYFLKLDEDWKERLASPKQEGFSNTFESPLIRYDNKTYSIGGTVFWTADEHKPHTLRVHLSDSNKDSKIIDLTDSNMELLPKLKEAIEKIGTLPDSVTAIKGSEGNWHQYRSWFDQKSTEQLETENFRLIQYKDQFYSIGFSIC